jgi:hypothetical protein
MSSSMVSKPLCISGLVVGYLRTHSTDAEQGNDAKGGVDATQSTDRSSADIDAVRSTLLRRLLCELTLFVSIDSRVGYRKLKLERIRHKPGLICKKKLGVALTCISSLIWQSVVDWTAVSISRCAH